MNDIESRGEFVSPQPKSIFCAERFRNLNSVLQEIDSQRLKEMVLNWSLVT